MTSGWGQGCPPHPTLRRYPLRLRRQEQREQRRDLLPFVIPPLPVARRNLYAPGFAAHTLHQPPCGTLLPTKMLQPPVASPGLP